MILTPQEWEVLGLSLKVASGALLLGLVPGIALGYLMARWHSRWRVVLDVAIQLPLVLPPVVTGYLLLLLLGRRSWLGGWLDEVFGVQLTFNIAGAALAAAVVGFPLLVRSVRLGFSEVDPRLEAASRTLGRGRWATFWRVSLPLAWRGVVAGGVLAFARALGEFGATVMLAGNIPGRTQTIPLAIYSWVQRPGGEVQAWRLVAISIVVAALALVAGEWLERRGGGKRRG